MENRLTLRERFDKAYNDLIKAGFKPKQISDIVGYKENASIFHLKNKRYGYKLSLDKVEKMENYIKLNPTLSPFLYEPDYKGEKY